LINNSKFKIYLSINVKRLLATWRWWWPRYW